MRNKIINIFIEKKRKTLINSSIIIPQEQSKDDFRQPEPVPVLFPGL